MAVFRIERTRDYTVMSNHHLRNMALSLKAKGLLSMMLSLPDDWNYTTRGLAKICKEGVDAIGGALRELETRGLHRPPPAAGPARAESATPSMSSMSSPSPKQPDTPQPDTAAPDTDSPDTENPYLDKPDTEKPAELNIEKSNTQKPNTQGSSTDSIPFRETAAARPPERKGRDAMSMVEMQNYRELILENIEYDHLRRQFATYREDLDEIVELIVETVCARRKTTRIAGADFPHEVVRSRFLKLDSGHIEFVMECMHKNTTEVRNMKQYLLTVLFNAPTTMNNHYTAQVNHDMYGRRLVNSRFSVARQKEARHEPDGNFQEPGVWQHPCRRGERQVPVLRNGCGCWLWGIAIPERCATSATAKGVSEARHPYGRRAADSSHLSPKATCTASSFTASLPSAERFERWVFDEVLPTIRQHGAYITREKLWEVATSPEALLKLCTDLLAEREKNAGAAGRQRPAARQGRSTSRPVHRPAATVPTCEPPPRSWMCRNGASSGSCWNERFVYRTPSGCVLPYAKPENEGLFCVKDFCSNGHLGAYTLVTPEGKLLFATLRDQYSDDGVSRERRIPNEEKQ